MKTLNRKLILIFIVFSLALVLVTNKASKFLMRESFNKYVEENIKKRKNEIVKYAEYAYGDNGWDVNLLENVGMDALEHGLIVKVTDNFNNDLWNATTHNQGMCEAVLESVIENMHEINPKIEGNYISEDIDLYVNGQKKGIIEIGYYGPYYYTEAEVIYFAALDNVLIFISFLAIVISCIIGVIIANSISKPIASVINATKLISEGNYKNRIKNKNNVEEINNMINSINKMAINLENQENIRKVLTKDISHELRTPITSILGQLDAIRDGIWQPTEQRINSIYEEIQRINRLIGSLENLSKFESQSLVLNKTLVNVNDLISNLFLNFEKQLLDKGITEELNLEKCETFIDKDKLSQAIINIISNAIKYTKAGGKISIGCFENKDLVFISIKDNGIGISEEHKPYIFERFYRVDESRARETGGDGIGLAITKAIIEAHNGNIHIVSNIKAGSEFIIELPK